MRTNEGGANIIITTPYELYIQGINLKNLRSGISFINVRAKRIIHKKPYKGLDVGIHFKQTFILTML